MEPHGLPAAGKLFTWVNVEERLGQLSADSLPDWLREADAWWDGLEITTAPGTDRGAVLRWLDEVFGRGSVTEGPEGNALVLDRPPGQVPALLPLLLSESSEEPENRQVPRLRTRGVSRSTLGVLPRPDCALPGDVQMAAFHSFKGGVGRTLHAVALADRLARRGRRVLLVDADLEAPGITWMHQAQGGRCDVAFEDVLALLHGSVDGDASIAVNIAARYLANQQPSRYAGGGQVAVLPACRRQKLGPPVIEPADLLTHDRPPYFLTESLAGLARAAGLDTVIVDLRAGASELSAPMLLDPRVQRVFVTTLSSQALEGTERLVRQLGGRAPALIGTDPAPAAIISQYRLDVHQPLAEEARERLAAALGEVVGFPEPSAETGTEGEGGESLAVDAEVLTEPVLSLFHEELMALPRKWDDVLDAIARCGLGERMEALAESIGAADAPESPGAGSPQNDGTLDDRRRRLRRRAGDLVFAEQTGFETGLGFLTTEPLRRLVGDHRTDLPVAVVIGAKGAGKTFTWARMCAAGTWSGFGAHIGEKVERDAQVVPVLDPEHLTSRASSGGTVGPQLLRDRMAPGGEGATAAEVRRTLRARFEQETPPTSAQWLDVWLRCLSRAAGATDSEADRPEEFLTDLARRREVLFVLDGLEDLLKTLDGDAKRMALWVLLTEVPDWLRSLRSRSLGLVVFVRRDLVRWAIRQNLGQFLQQYEPYALHWDSQEALRLALWVAVEASVVDRPGRALTDLGREEIAEALVSLWGVKLGRATSKEARTERWVPAALADFNEQVQARDVVRFLKEAAELSLEDRRKENRVLTPGAMRQALGRCSTEKVDEIGQENPELNKLFERMRRHAPDVIMPFEADEVGLGVKEIQTLKEAGALSQDHDGRYRMPEIYRHALGFRTRGRARVVRP